MLPARLGGSSVATHDQHHHCHHHRLHHWHHLVVSESYPLWIWRCETLIQRKKTRVKRQSWMWEIIKRNAWEYWDIIQPYLSSACLHITEIILLILWVILRDAPATGLARPWCWWWCGTVTWSSSPGLLPACGSLVNMGNFSPPIRGRCAILHMCMKCNC